MYTKYIVLADIPVHSNGLYTGGVYMLGHSLGTCIHFQAVSKLSVLKIQLHFQSRVYLIKCMRLITQFYGILKKVQLVTQATLLL